MDTTTYALVAPARILVGEDGLEAHGLTCSHATPARPHVGTVYPPAQGPAYFTGVDAACAWAHAGADRGARPAR